MRKLYVFAAVPLFASLPVMAEQPSTQPSQLTGIVLTTDRTVDATSSQSIAKGVWHDGMTEQQKSYAMWRFFIERNMHKEAADVTIDPGNASELLIKDGYCVCGQWAGLYAGCMSDDGMKAAVVFLDGHVIDGVYYWGDWHAYDTDMQDLYVKANGVVANPNDIRHKKTPDGKWLYRDGAPIKSYPWYIGPDSLSEVEHLYNQVSIGQPPPSHTTRKWVYNLCLRPGQEISWNWYGDPEIGQVCLSHLPDVYSKKPVKSLREYLEGTFDYYTSKDDKPKWNWGYRRGGLVPNPLQTWNGVDGNGRLTMDLGANGFKNALAMMSASDNLEVRDGKLALRDPAKPGTFTLDFSLPYDYGDGWIEKPLAASGMKIELIEPGSREATQVYPGGKGVDDGQRIRLFDLVRDKSDFSLKVTLDPQSQPLANFKAVGVFNFCNTVMPYVLKGKNQVSVRLADEADLAQEPLHVTYVYDQASDSVKDKAGGKQVMCVEKVLTFKPGELTQPLDAGDHWPLMREIRMTCGGDAPPAAAPAPETGELDWAAAPWQWDYCGVNFWNDFERGDRQGWAGQLTTDNTFNGSDFSLKDSLLWPDGKRQLKLIRFGGFLNHDSRFKCELWVKNVGKFRISTRNQGEAKDGYYVKDITDLKDGAWQPIEVAFDDLSNLKDASKKIKTGEFLANVYLQVWPAEGKQISDVQFMIDNPVCYDGDLKDDPCSDPEAAEKSLADDPIWNAKPPATTQPDKETAKADAK